MGAGGLGRGDGYAGYRAQLVEALRDKGIQDLRVLHAIATVPRHRFVPDAMRHRAYEDVPLPIGLGQTISQPYVHARSLELLRLSGNDRVLEVGAGSGYQTALLAELAGTVLAVERVPELAQAARAALEDVGVKNATVVVGDGTLGWRAYAPFDAIVVSAASPSIPKPLIEQLSDGGRMVIPLGDQESQVLTLVEKTGEQIRTSTATGVRFVPLLGEFGFKPREEP
ncbi:MAG TPA: protein-L-isoaspartate(D-aspartate) O-methyltransferase [Gemmatimonadales bacterium]|jgi:protein-L-isoaspartate(D-aspartate) O-methyltransferase|nr:protein-L-isoaspartate(D-aspartate) O-methyltransferase [Gemmatimonadales bacterium]